MITSWLVKGFDHVTGNLFVLGLSCLAGHSHCSAELSPQLLLWRQFTARRDCNTLGDNVANIMEDQSKLRILEKINQMEGELLEHVREKLENLRAEIHDIAEQNNAPLQDQQDQVAWDDVEVFDEDGHGEMEQMLEVEVQQQDRKDYYRNNDENAGCRRLHKGEKQAQCVLVKGL